MLCSNNSVPYESPQISLQRAPSFRTYVTETLRHFLPKTLSGDSLNFQDKGPVLEFQRHRNLRTTPWHFHVYVSVKSTFCYFLPNARDTIASPKHRLLDWQVRPFSALLGMPFVTSFPQQTSPCLSSPSLKGHLISTVLWISFSSLPTFSGVFHGTLWLYIIGAHGPVWRHSQTASYHPGCPHNGTGTHREL